MSPFREAVRRIVVSDLQCPKCGACNLPNASLTVCVDPITRDADCANCGHAWTERAS